MSQAAQRFIGQRLLALWCIPWLMVLMLWSSISGTVALVVTLWWFGRIGGPLADAWAAARVRGRSVRGAAGEARWPAAFVLLVAAVALALASVAVLRHGTPLGGWLDDPGLTKPVVAVLVLLLAAVPGVLVVRRGAGTDWRGGQQ